MNKFEEKMKQAFTPGTTIGKFSFGLAFFLIALLIVLLGFWKALFITAVTLLGIFIGSAESIGKATSKLLDKIVPGPKKIVYTAEDIEKVKKAADLKRANQAKSQEPAAVESDAKDKE